MNFSVFDNHIDATFIIDENRRLEYVNQASCTILSISLKRIKYDKMMHEYITFADETLFCMPGGERGKDEFSPYREMGFTTYKGAEGTALVSISPISNTKSDDNKKLWAVFIKDMTVEIQLQRKYKDQLDQKQGVIDELNLAKEKLQKYSENLEAMVAERTRELSDANRFINTMIDSLDQGLFVFNQIGECQDVYTKACERLFGMEPPGKKIWEVLHLGSEKETNSIKQWIDLIYEEMLPFEDAVPLGPTSTEIEEKFISLNYFPMRGEDNKLQGIVAVASDVTEELKAKAEAKEQSEYVQMILKILKDKNRFLHFINDSKKLVSELSSRLQQNIDDELFYDACRILHTVKGGSSLYSLQNLAAVAHHYEEKLQPIKQRALSGDQSFLEDFISLKSELIDDMKNLQEAIQKSLEELKDIIGKGAIDGKSRVEIPIKDLLEFQEHINNEKLIQEFRESFLKQPLWDQFLVFNTLMQELALDLGKRIKPIQFEGDNINIDPQSYQVFFDSLVHMFRNIIDHGIESEDQRIEKEKDPHGHVVVETKTDSGKLSIIIKDDGAGIDPQSIISKLASNGMDTSGLEDKSDHEIQQYIFKEGFSTRDAISDVSGRGVGMDAIKNTVEKMGGSVEVFSEIGTGTKFQIRLPLDKN